MRYDRGDSVPFDYKPNGIPIGSENVKENCHHEHIPFNVKGIGSIVFSVQDSDAPWYCLYKTRTSTGPSTGKVLLNSPTAYPLGRQYINRY